ncbi:unnamed protein product [Mytilus edulis]|uniref:Uncharacterized protein n=1 Tax=Mytilus edulis TaxID=6550 RepID=A0A8S3UAI1_MYTED|nr:unnamed protein product [Mytilus edulis]
MTLLNLETNNSIPNIHMHTSNNSFRYSPDDGANWFSIALSTGSYDIENINNEIQLQLHLNKHKTKIIIMIAKDYSTSHGYQTTLNAYKRLDKAVSVALCACSVGSLVLTSSTLGSALTGTGLIATLPLGFLACLNATTVMDLTPRHVTKKIKKHHNTLRLVQSKKSLVEQCVSSALADDEQIDNVEFGKVVTCLKNYYDHKDQLQQPMSNFTDELSKCSF